MEGELTSRLYVQSRAERRLQIAPSAPAAAMPSTMEGGKAGNLRSSVTKKFRLGSCGFSSEEPLYAVSISEPTIEPEWHLFQVDLELLVCPIRQSVEDFSKISKLIASDVDGRGVPLLGHPGGMQPIGSRELDCIALQMSVRDSVVFLCGKAILHRRIPEPRKGKTASEAGLIERHGISTVAVKEEEWGNTKH